MKHRKTLLIVLFPMIIAAIALLVFLFNTSEETISFSGLAEASAIDVASKIPGRVETVFFKEGDHVESGMILATLESKEMDAKLNQTKALMEAAKARYDMAINGARNEEKEAAEKMYQAALNQYELAKNTRDRMEKLHRDSLISSQEMDKYEYTFRTAREQMDAVKARYEMALNGARLEEIRMAEGLYNQAASGFQEADAYFHELTLKTPLAGEVQKRLVDPGEIVPAGYPVFTIIDLRDIWVTLQVKEMELNRFEKGNTLKGSIPGLNGREEEFTVSYISPMGDFAGWKPTNRKGDFDIRTFEVRLRPIKAIENFRPGMSVHFKVQQ